MSEPANHPTRSIQSRRRSAQARRILARHFGLGEMEVDRYFATAAKRERRKVSEIENALIGLAHELC